VSDVATKACNVCGRLKQEANHWLVAVDCYDTLQFWPATRPTEPPLGQTTEDICGADCAHKRLSQWLTQQGI
jgi:hypothetical protein